MIPAVLFDQIHPRKRTWLWKNQTFNKNIRCIYIYTYKIIYKYLYGIFLLFLPLFWNPGGFLPWIHFHPPWALRSRGRRTLESTYVVETHGGHGGRTVVRLEGKKPWLDHNWLVVEPPTHLKNMRHVKLGWLIFPQFSGWKWQMFELPPPREGEGFSGGTKHQKM